MFPDRYYQMLKRGFGVAWGTVEPVEEIKNQQHFLFGLAADLSMLRLLEAFLESVPQLLLQLYIVLGQQECSLVQREPNLSSLFDFASTFLRLPSFAVVGMSFSFMNAAWALVDYRRCLRRSLPDVRQMPRGLPTAVYLLYKLFTITSRVLGYALLLIFSIYSTVGLAIVWLLGTAWTHRLHTDFCSSQSLEFLYRAIVGVILTFTFFNVKGQGTRDAMITYYFLHSLINVLSLLLLFVLRPDLLTLAALLCVSMLMAACSVLGLVCLVLYYLLLHPTEACREADEVDGLEIKTRSKGRLRDFLYP